MSLTPTQIIARRDNIKRLFDSAGSTIFAVEFIKKDGEKRTMNVQTPAIQKHLVGGAASDSAKRAVETRKERHPHLLAVFDIAAQAIRSINLDTVLSVTVRKTRFEVGPAVAA